MRQLVRTQGSGLRIRAGAGASACVRLSIGGLLLAAAVGTTAVPARAPEGDQARMLELINQERAARKLRPLSWSDELAKLADAHARDMSRAGEISHHSTGDGATFSERAARAKLRARAVAENVGVAPNVVSAHRGLMESPGHRANLLDGEMDAIGIGLSRGADGRELFVAQDFAALLPDLSDAEAAVSLKAALQRAAGARMLLEDAALSRRLTDDAARLARADSVSGHGIAAPPPSWVLTFTSVDPGSIPRDLASHVASARGFGLGVVFARTRRYPLGAWWVAVALLEGRAQP